MHACIVCMYVCMYVCVHEVGFGCYEVVFLSRVVHLGSRSAYIMIIQGSEELCKKIVSETITRGELEDYMDQFVR